VNIIKWPIAIADYICVAKMGIRCEIDHVILASLVPK